MEQVYGGIDLHSNNSVVAIVDAQGTKVFGRRLVNDLARIEQCLGKYRERLCGVVIESTLNWYWLVDGLMERGYQVHLANTTAIEQYNGLKHTDDDSDAEYLANLLRLGILPEGYIRTRCGRRVIRSPAKPSFCSRPSSGNTTRRLRSALRCLAARGWCQRGRPTFAHRGSPLPR